MALEEHLLPHGEEQGVKKVAGGWLDPTVGHDMCHLLLWCGSLSLRPPGPTRTYLSKADPWLWLLVRREKTLRSLRGRVGGDEGGVKPTSGGLSQEGLEGHVSWELLTRHLPSAPVHIQHLSRLSGPPSLSLPR